MDETDAAAVVGAAMGAVGAAALVSLRAAQDPERVRDAMRSAADQAIARD